MRRSWSSRPTRSIAASSSSSRPRARAGAPVRTSLVTWPAGGLGQASRRPASLDFFEVVSAAPYASIVPFGYWRTGASDADDLATLVRLVAAGHVHPEIGLQADGHETPDVLVALAERRVRGNAVLTFA